MPPSHKKIYIPLSLVHLIYTAGDNCMRKNACYNYTAMKLKVEHLFTFHIAVKWGHLFSGD